MVFSWLTITGANYPSQLLADGLFWVQDRLTELFVYLNAPDWLHGILILGVYRVLAWVVIGYAPRLWQSSFRSLPRLRMPDICPVLPIIWINPLSAAVPAENRRSVCMGFRRNATRRHWSPDHRLAQGTSAGNPDQQFCAVQREVPDADCNINHVLCRHRRGALLPSCLRFC